MKTTFSNRLKSGWSVENGGTDMPSFDLLEQIGLEAGYDERRVREMKLLSLLFQYGWMDDTEERISFVKSLGDTALNRLSLQIITGGAELAIDRTMRRLYGNLSPSHQIDGADVGPGRHHMVLDQGRPAFGDAFDAEFWSRPPGSDRTLKDPLHLLSPEDQMPNLGHPVEAEEG